MVPFHVILGIISSLTISGAVNIPTARSPVKKLTVTPLNSKSAGKGNSPIFDLQNIRYATNISINGVEISVALDTGSTDLWVQVPRGLGTYNDTKIPLSLLYGDGTYGVNGTIGVAPVEIGPYKVDHQAFLNADTVRIAALEDLGLSGIFGLGFDQVMASPIIHKIQTLYGPSATWGSSVLNNTFSQNPQQPNLVAFDLSRSDDLESSGDGSFTIGEYDPDYIAVEKAPKLLKYPPPPVGYRWLTVFDAIEVNGRHINISSRVKGVPKRKGVALFDTGNPNADVPRAVLDAVYSGVQDAVKNNHTGKWIIPCQSSSIPTLSFVFGFNFGDTSANGEVTGDAYIQLLSKTNIKKAYADYTSSRAKSLKKYTDPEILPAQLLKLIQPDNDSSANSSSSATSSNDKNTKPADSSEVDGSSDSASIANIIDKDQTRLTESSETDSSLVAKYGPTIIGLLAANVVISLILVVLGVLQYIRRGASSESRTVNPPLRSSQK